jgi:NAD(P)-dependent dehydrogenase (short-subunit alcohol dehydrogenase family)
MNGILNGRSAIVTGGSQGLGLEIARAFLRAGARVLLCARDGAALERARDELARGAKPPGDVRSMAADVSRPADAARIVQSALDAFGPVQILVNNAGVYGPFGRTEEADWSEWVRAVEINLFGSVLLCRALLPHFRSRRYGKIVQLSGGGATGPLPRIGAYAASKAAVVRFAETLAEEVREDGIDVNSIAPGALNTRLLDAVLDAGPDRVGSAFYRRALRQRDGGGASPVRAAELAVFLASAASDGITGRLISAVWDPWEHLPEHAAELRESDVYTLRRIVPADRGLDWGETKP